MAGAHGLHRLTLAAIRSAPQCPLVAGANRIHRVPEVGRDSRIGWVLQHASQLTFFDLPANFRTELEVIAFVINGPGTVRLEVDTVVRVGDELLEGQRLFSRQNADIGHANQWNAVPAFR